MIDTLYYHEIGFLFLFSTRVHDFFSAPLSALFGCGKMTDHVTCFMKRTLTKLCKTAKAISNYYREIVADIIDVISMISATISSSSSLISQVWSQPVASDSPLCSSEWSSSLAAQSILVQTRGRKEAMQPCRLSYQPIDHLHLRLHTSSFIFILLPFKMKRCRFRIRLVSRLHSPLKILPLMVEWIGIQKKGCNVFMTLLWLTQRERE